MSTCALKPSSNLESMLRRLVIAVVGAGATYAFIRWATGGNDEQLDQNDEDRWLMGADIPRSVKLPGDGWFHASGRESAGPRAIP